LPSFADFRNSLGFSEIYSHRTLHPFGRLYRFHRHHSTTGANEQRIRCRRSVAIETFEYKSGCRGNYKVRSDLFSKKAKGFAMTGSFDAALTVASDSTSMINT
jgi:hypothetical protein